MCHCCVGGNNQPSNRNFTYLRPFGKAYCFMIISGKCYYCKWLFFLFRIWVEIASGGSRCRCKKRNSSYIFYCFNLYRNWIDITFSWWLHHVQVYMFFFCARIHLLVKAKIGIISSLTKHGKLPFVLSQWWNICQLKTHGIRSLCCFAAELIYGTRLRLQFKEPLDKKNILLLLSQAFFLTWKHLILNPQWGKTKDPTIKKWQEKRHHWEICIY